MQALWLQFDKIAGKGISVLIILKFLGYMALMMVPTALPIAILLSSIMALGNMAENYEFAAVKSAGISLQKIYSAFGYIDVGAKFFQFFVSELCISICFLEIKELDL